MLAALRYTPGQLRGVLAIVAALILGAGITGMTAILAKSAVIEETTSQSGRLSVAALQLYQALSQADATAASSYLTGGTPSEEMNDTYRTAMRDATVAIATAAGEVKTAADTALVAELNARLPVYTGLVETARTFNRLGEPVGATYQEQASTLMRQEMLPSAHDLQENALGQLSESRAGAEAFPWVAAALTVAALGTLIWAQLWLSRKTNRVFNLGLLGATVLLLGFAGWLATASLASASHTTRSHEDGAVPLELLAQAEITAQQARAEESLLLIARGEDQGASDRYEEHITALTGEGSLLDRLDASFADDPELADSIATAREAAETWRSGHDEVVKLAREGNYAEAVAMAVGDEEQSLSTSFDALNSALTEATRTSADRFAEATTDAQRSLSGAAAGLAALALGALICAAVGIQMRVAEYYA
ncbi:MCP four helix bundle domain-containing protein [Glycomyces sp. TRM65418]|uniref:CHASE3 domain-containing protein n=1 Tax=Glycomyces sp. TRM65418 TaxID=2867006 RepID=UPI001CE54A9D|nr:MCP four helix bundle domain-containing protein [Glycomyces sp. TRM65418]MCC3764903.1 MCP four helix bundle domain-containing protein [Glycomyces sp. TRM65418]QZD54544.1 MCP four helix bundle domain-containing protein [Glycomyces sp. TRM65418]